MALGIGQMCVEHPGLVLEIVQGRTQFKERPITSARFLIGSGEACDLRLSSADIPPLHSLLIQESGQVLLEVIAASPDVLINGQPVREALVQDGDLIRIGVFELRARFASRPAVAGALEPAVEMQETEVGHLTAEELVDRLQEETKFLTDVDSKRRLGLQALLSAVTGQQASRPAPAHTLQGPHFAKRARPGETPELLAQDLENLSRVLDVLSRQLDEQSQGASQRESTYVAATEELLESHDRLAEQVEWLARQVTDLQSRLPGRSRASA